MCIITQNFIKIGHIIMETLPFLDFQDGGCSLYAILDFQNVKLLVANWNRRDNMHHCTKLNQN